MKTLISILTLAVFVAFMASDASAQSQEKKVRNQAKTATVQGQNQTHTPGPNFIDADNDGICDNLENGTPIRKRLRDGSCGNTPNENCTGTGTGTGTGTQQRRGRGGK